MQAESLPKDLRTVDRIQWTIYEGTIFLSSFLCSSRVWVSPVADSLFCVTLIDIDSGEKVKLDALKGGGCEAHTRQKERREKVQLGEVEEGSER